MGQWIAKRMNDGNVISTAFFVQIAWIQWPRVAPRCIMMERVTLQGPMRLLQLFRGSARFLRFLLPPLIRPCLHMSQGTAAIADALAANESIKIFSMNGNYAGGMGAAALAKALETNTSLEQLSLNGNDIGNEGMRVIASGLAAHKGKITSLDFGNNKLEADCLGPFSDYLKDNKTCVPRVTWYRNCELVGPIANQPGEFPGAPDIKNDLRPQSSHAPCCPCCLHC